MGPYTLHGRPSGGGSEHGHGAISARLWPLVMMAPKEADIFRSPPPHPNPEDNTVIFKTSRLRNSQQYLLNARVRVST